MTAPNEQGTIVVPLDGSTLAEQAIPLAIALANGTRRRVRMVYVQQLAFWTAGAGNHVVQRLPHQLLHAEGEGYLRETCQRFAVPGVVIESRVLQGEMADVAQVLQDHVEREGVEMVVMATHGHGGVRRAWLGSVADFLVRHLEIPVFLVRPGMDLAAAGRHILVPVDGSPFGETILDQAVAIAQASQLEIILLQVVQPVMQPLPGIEAPYVGIDTRLTAMHQSAAEDYLHDLGERIRERGVKATTMVTVSQSPATTMTELARPANFAMIVMATHGRGGLRRFVMGSVADKVMRDADVPVMLMRPKAVPAPSRETVASARLAGPTSCAV